MKTMKTFALLLIMLAWRNQNYSQSAPIYFQGSAGDKISLYANRLGMNNMYGLGVGDLTMYSKSPGNYAWMQNQSVVANDDQYDIFNKSIMHLTGGANGTILTLREPLTPSATHSGEIRLLETGSSNYYGGFMRYDGQANSLILGSYTSGSRYDAITILRDSRNVGVGVSDPLYELDVDGALNLRKVSETALRVNGARALWYDGTYFSWGYDAQYNYFASRVGIGTSNPHADYMLSVNGKIRAKEVRVESGWADYVFEEGYALPTLDSVETFIAENGHLPGIPSAAEISENGLDLGEIDALMMQKIEELTLYMIELKKENEALKSQLGIK